MKCYKNYLLAGSGLLILLGSFVLGVPRPTQGQGGDDTGGPTRPVKVVNTTADPIPVTGNITGNVNVVNAIRVIDTPRQPFDAGAEVSFSDGGKTAEGNLITVPPGKQLVVTYASASIRLPTEQRVSIRILKINPAGGTANFFELVAVETGTPAGRVASEPLNIYLDSGYSLLAIVARNSTTGIGSGNVNVSGYLVDVP